MLSKCDTCQYEWELEKMETTKLDDIEKVFFICPNCQKEYIAFYTNAEIRKMRARMKQASRKEYQRLVRMNKKLMKELREKMEGDE